MYKCDICSKVCSSQKKYLSHVETCNVNRIDSLSRSSSMIDILDDRSVASSSASSIFSAANKPLLKDTIEKLMKDRTRYKDELKKVTREKEELTSKIIETKRRSSDITSSQLAQLSESTDVYKQENVRLTERLETEREETRKHILKLQNDKELLAVMLKQEKEQSIITLSAEKDNLVQSLQFIISKLKKEKENSDKEHDIVIQERNNTIDRLKQIYMQTSEKAIKDNKDILDHVQHQAIQTEHIIKEKYEKDKQILLINHLEAINKINLDNSYAIENINKKHRDDIHNRDKAIAELEQINHNIGSQVSNYLSTIDTMTEDITRLKQQFLSKLNSQQEENEKALRERDLLISKLELDVKNAYDKTKNELHKENTDMREKTLRLTTQFTTELNKQRKELLEESDKLRLSRDADRKDFMSQMNNLQAEYDKKEKELNKQLEDKTEQLEKLKIFASENMLKMKQELQIMSQKTK